MKLPRPLSHSSINMYQECPQKWKLKYLDGLPEKPRHFFSFGKSMHSALEFFYGGKDLSAPDLGQLLTQYKHHWISEGYTSPRQERQYFEDGQRILSSFHAKHAQDFTLPLSVEYA